MCVMEVRPGQHSVTIAQACAHNVNTVRGDLEMFRPLLEARGETDMVRQLETAAYLLDTAYQSLLAMYGAELDAVVKSGAQHLVPFASGERIHAPATDIAEIAEIAAHRAAKFETR